MGALLIKIGSVVELRFGQERIITSPLLGAGQTCLAATLS